jgi:ComF family protein
LSNSANAALYKWRAAAADGARAAVAFALPQRCALCACAAGDACLCGACLDAIATRTPACPRCALTSPGGEACGRCLVHPPAWDAALAAGFYAFPLDRLVQRLKYGGDLPLASALGELLSDTVLAVGATSRVDAIVPMPLAAARQRERGYNQAREIARAVARATRLPLRSGLERSHHAVPQAALPWRERVRNVRGAFAGARVALVDDVMTSGATAAAATAALRRGGASRVEVWVVARTLPARG